MDNRIPLHYCWVVVDFYCDKVHYFHEEPTDRELSNIHIGPGPFFIAKITHRIEQKRTYDRVPVKG